MAQTQEFIATGRRKTSVARIRMTPGSGKIDINGKSFEDYFPTVPLQNTVLQPLAGGEADEFLRSFHQHHGRRRHRPGRRGAARDLAGALAGGCESSRNAQSGRIAPARSADERAEKIRPARRAETLPILEALIAVQRLLRWRCGAACSNCSADSACRYSATASSAEAAAGCGAAVATRRSSRRWSRGAALGSYCGRRSGRVVGGCRRSWLGS